ncbi:riboflavin synthase [Legionella worsleiensis]|uniref:Riboflavin synthase n=1 Tax=Legionella worsleiensis TaxID=45076 RepID=A0A0W1A5S8_9GAMM|nr:riboflavin synthase [Legionella worsleiensis]KTD76702.1 riboflavin synthase subunit alpha [Legionella worsleiensis]STY30473.1 riboflavin synthase subunit alpha [Legionella worsleiensis]
MFTGLIEKTGEVLANHEGEWGNKLIISSTYEHLEVGESIAVNGVCLTLLSSECGNLHFDVSPETLKITTLGRLLLGDLVNLERSMMAATRFGGHYVTGHVESTAVIKSIKPMNEYVEMEVDGFAVDSLFYLIPKGSITVEGVSLTINEVINQSIKLMLVPHTLLHTSLRTLRVGQQVNIEFDYLTRIVAHQLQIAGKLNYEVEK